MNECEQGQLLYVAYNDYEMAEGILTNALQVDPKHLLARMHLDIVRSLRRADALVPYQPLPGSMSLTHLAAAPVGPGAWGQGSGHAAEMQQDRKVNKAAHCLVFPSAVTCARLDVSRCLRSCS